MHIGIGCAITQRQGLPIDAAIRALFANSEQGAWFDASDMSAMYQDSAGTTPVTEVEQHVKKMLDKSGRGNHAVGASTVQPSITARSNSLINARWIGGGAAPARWNQPAGTGTSAPNGVINGYTVYRQTAVAQRPFLASIDLLRLGPSGSIACSVSIGTIYSGSAAIQDTVAFSPMPAGATLTYFVDGIPVAATTPITANTRITCVIKSGGTAGNLNARIGAGCGQNVTADFDMAAPQADRPGPASAGWPLKLFYGLGDASLSTTFAAPLGTNCTIARAIPSVGASILTGQTVGATYIDSMDNSGVVLVDRPITTEERASLVAYLNRLAGVTAETGLSSTKRALQANAADVQVLILGDSTGNDTDDWVFRASRWLASEYPAYTVSYRLWNDATNAYAAETVLSNGTGPHTLRIWNASVGGTSVSHMMGAKYAAAVSATSPSVVIWNYGHNMLASGDPLAEFLGPIDQVRATFPTIPHLMCMQNARRDDDLYQPMASTIATIPSHRSFVDTVDIHSAFLSAGRNPNLYNDNIHPNLDGSLLWVNTVMSKWRTSIAS